MTIEILPLLTSLISGAVMFLLGYAIGKKTAERHWKMNQRIRGNW